MLWEESGRFKRTDVKDKRAVADVGVGGVDLVGGIFYLRHH